VSSPEYRSCQYQFDPRAWPIEAELSGVKRKDMTITLASGLLTIKGDVKQGVRGEAWRRHHA
jgi:HSP20 family molecular chaperone IbpA